MKFFRKLNSRGVAHHFALVVIVLGVAIGGTAYLVANYADSNTLGNAYVSDLTSDCTALKTSLAKSSDTKDVADVANCASAAHPYMLKAGNDGQAGSYVAYASNTTEQADDKSACEAGIKGSSSASAIAKAVASCQAALGADENTAAANPHKYEGHIEPIADVNICKDIEVEAHDYGSIPYSDDNMTAYLELSGGPYKSTSILGPSVVNDNNISGTATADNYHHWTTPVAIQDYYGKTPITITMVLRAKGNDVSFISSPTTDSKTITVPASKDCGTPPKAAPKTTTTETSTGHDGKAPVTTTTTKKTTENAPTKTQVSKGKTNAHQYEAHIVSTVYCTVNGTAGNIEVEAHDFGASPTPGKDLKVVVTFHNGAAAVKGSTLKELSGFADSLNNNSKSSLPEFARWTTPAAIANYSVDNFTKYGNTTADLSVYSVNSAGKETKVVASGTQSVALLPCVPSTQKDKQGQTITQISDATCDKEFKITASSDATAVATIHASASYISCVNLQNQASITQTIASEEANEVKKLAIKLPESTTKAIAAACQAEYVDSTATATNKDQAIANCESSKQSAALDKLALTKIDSKITTKTKTLKKDKKTYDSAKTQITKDRNIKKNYPKKIKSLDQQISSASSSLAAAKAALNTLTESQYSKHTNCTNAKWDIGVDNYCAVVWDHTNKLGTSPESICSNITVDDYKVATVTASVTINGSTDLGANTDGKAVVANLAHFTNVAARSAAAGTNPNQGDLLFEDTYISDLQGHSVTVKVDSTSTSNGPVTTYAPTPASYTFKDNGGQLSGSHTFSTTSTQSAKVSGSNEQAQDRKDCANAIGSNLSSFHSAAATTDQNTIATDESNVNSLTSQRNSDQATLTTAKQNLPKEVKIRNKNSPNVISKISDRLNDLVSDRRWF